MDENPNELASDAPPNRDEGAALSIEAGGPLDAGGSLTGTTIGHYLVEERLGGGTMAAVYRADDQVLDRAVAIKVLLPGADTVMQERFRREANMVSQLVHPHIVRTLQVGGSGGIIYIAMELVEGVSLGDLLDRYGKLSVGDAARILAPVAKALAYAHNKGIIHRDVKPTNILLQRATRGAANSVTIAPFPYPVIPLLSDFGIARALDAPELTFAGRTIGTPAFMAPEQCAGSADIDGRADVYALGAVLYRCLVGRTPFVGSTTQILHAHVYDALMIPEHVAAALPAPVVEILKRAMAKEPSERYQNVEVFAAELERVATLPLPKTPETTEELAESTMTMASLPVTKPPSTNTMRVLVPSAPVTMARPTPAKPVLRPSTALSTPARSIPIVPPPPRASRTRQSRWVMPTLITVAALLLVTAIAWSVNSLLPGLGEENTLTGDPTATPAAVAVNGTPELPGVEPDASPDGMITVVAPSETAQPAAQVSRPTPEPTPTGPTPTPRPPLQPENLEPTWNDALASYEEGDWRQAISFLILVQRTLDTAEYSFERQIDRQLLQEMLITSYVGVATEAASDGQFEAAITDLTKALALAPNSRYFTAMITDLEKLAELKSSTDATVEAQRESLWAALGALLGMYAEQLENEGKICEAVIQVKNAIKLADSEELQERQALLNDECERLEATNAIVEVGGSILYSSENNGTFTIWRFPITRNNLLAKESTSLVSNATQPQLSPNGYMLAYHSRVGGNDGLFGIAMGVGLQPLINNNVRFGPNPEDSRHGPVSWNSSSTRLAYSTIFSNQPSRVFVTSADEATSAIALGDGKDPAWSPVGVDDLIVFNGPDTAGQNPGLRAMGIDASGSDRYLVTDTANGNDSRPIWSPDGKYVVFMSKDRGGESSWEVYRLTWGSGEIIRLTDRDAGQDGLPTISPDGKWVAFMSDRDGVWRLYYVSIDGGPVHLLSDIKGQPLSWLEHTIQWVE